jgi:hypothetical protein
LFGGEERDGMAVGEGGELGLEGGRGEKAVIRVITEGGLLRVDLRSVAGRVTILRETLTVILLRQSVNR